MRKDSQRTAAYQSNKNILLTDKAVINTKPFLEIYADDVKCSHGATVGQLDQEAMFYLRSRGIDEANARLLLMYAFAADVVGKISIPTLQDRLDDLIKNASGRTFDLRPVCTALQNSGAKRLFLKLT